MSTQPEQKMGLLHKIKEGFTHHVLDSTAIMTESNPIFAASEVVVSGMSYDASLNARLFVTAGTFAGAGWLYGKGRDVWRKTFQVTDQTKERIQQIHDGVYAATFSTLTMPFVYLLSGAKDLKEIAIGTASAVAIGAVNGIPLGYSIDLFRDLTGLQSSARVPKLIQERSLVTKKSLAALLVGTSLGLTATVYKTFT